MNEFNCSHWVRDYFVGNSTVQAKVRYSSTGATLQVSLEFGLDTDSFDLPEFSNLLDDVIVLEKEIGWGEIEESGRFAHPDGYLVGIAQEMAGQVVRQAIAKKRPGVAYCDGGC